MADDLPWNSILAAARAGADWTQYVRVKDARTYAASGSAARQHFQWQSSIIPTSLLTPHDANDRTSAAAYAAAAVKLHKKILVLSGERSSRRSLLDNFRALELLVRPDAADVAAAGGNALPDLREELYFQLIKQLEDNPRAESEAILWRLLCFACVSVVLDRSVNSPVHVTAAATARNLMPASAARTPHLALVHVVGFLLSRQESAAAGAARGDARPAAVLSYASYALRALELLQDPSLAAAPIFDDDLYAFLSHPPVAVDVLHPDGTVRSMWGDRELLLGGGHIVSASPRGPPAGHDRSLSRPRLADCRRAVRSGRRRCGPRSPRDAGCEHIGRRGRVATLLSLHEPCCGCSAVAPGPRAAAGGHASASAAVGRAGSASGLRRLRGAARAVPAPAPARGASAPCPPRRW